jgi:small subunit ribosomal protein S17
LTPSLRTRSTNKMLALRRAALLRPQVRCLAAFNPPTTQKKQWGPPTPPTTTNLPRGCLVGSVVSTAMAKTVNVDVTRTKIVPKYRKARRYSRRFLAHDENQECSLGDVVRIAPCRPLSRRKHFVVQEILKKN